MLKNNTTFVKKQHLSPAEDEGSHATSLGTHNLSMTGDMPIAHPSTASLLAHLNFALVHDADEMEISRRAHKVAWHVGIVKASIACKGITAACLCIMQPVKFRCRHAAAKKRHTSASNCYHWIKLLEDKIREEHAQSTTSGSSPAAPTAQQAQLGLVAAPGHAPPPANGRVMEVAAVVLDGEEGGQTFPSLHYGPLPPDHPQRYFWAGQEEADWMRKPNSGAGGSNDPQPTQEQPMGQPDAAHSAYGAEQGSRTTDAGTAVQDAEPTEEEMLAEAETIASLILLGRRSPSTQFDPRADQPTAPAPPSLPPSPPEATPAPTQRQVQAPRSRPATPPLTRQRTGIEASGDALPSASGDDDIDAIVALLDVDASTEAINAAADREMRDAPELTDHAEAEEMLRAWSTPRDATQRHAPDRTDGPATGTLLWFVIATEGPAALPYCIGKMFSADASQTRASRRYFITPEPPRRCGTAYLAASTVNAAFTDAALGDDAFLIDALARNDRADVHLFRY